MKRPFLIFCLFILVSLVGFLLLYKQEPVKFTRVEQGKFSISVPEYLTPTDSIDPAALLQYQNEKEQMFLLVYEKADTVEHSFEDFFKKFANDLIARVGDATLLKYYPKKINGCNAIIGNIRGKVNGTGVYYRVALVEARNAFYEIIVGIADDNRSNFEEDINSVIHGFRPAQ